MQQAQSDPHERLVQLKRRGRKLGRVRIGALRADIVFDAERASLLVRRTQAVEPVDSLLFACKAGSCKLLISICIAGGHLLLGVGVMNSQPRLSELRLALPEEPPCVIQKSAGIQDRPRRNEQRHGKCYERHPQGADVVACHARGLYTMRSSNRPLRAFCPNRVCCPRESRSD